MVKIVGCAKFPKFINTQYLRKTYFKGCYHYKSDIKYCICPCGHLVIEGGMKNV